jgi:hypothetical protein
MNGTRGVPHRPALALLALAAIVAYAPTLTIPLLEDDYPNLLLSQQLGGPAEIAALFHNPVFRLRATSLWIMFALWPVAKLTPLVYRLVSLIIHIANTWLLYGICLAWPRTRAQQARPEQYAAAFWAAAFFAVAEGHQEAVMWFSAINELLQFLFGMGALWCWLRDGGWRIRVVGWVLFALALLSKESAVVFLPLLLLTDSRKPWRLVPYLALATIAIASVVASRDISFRFSDGSFSLHAPFWITWPESYLRLLWIWGVVAIPAILLARDRTLTRSALAAAAWIAISLAPYSFLTYSTRIPSRQTYLASAGLAMLVGLAAAHWQALAGARRTAVVAVAAVVLLHNVVYLWTKKQRQFEERAAPTEQLIAFAKRTSGPIWVECFPRNHYIAEEAVHLGAGHEPSDLIWDEAEAKRLGAAAFCYNGPRP